MGNCDWRGDGGHYWRPRPWMFMVHAKLAVLSTQVGRLETKVDRMVDADQDRLPQCIQHETALKELERRWEMHALQIENLSDRLQDSIRCQCIRVSLQGSDGQ